MAKKQLTIDDLMEALKEGSQIQDDGVEGKRVPPWKGHTFTAACNLCHTDIEVEDGEGMCPGCGVQVVVALVIVQKRPEQSKRIELVKVGEENAAPASKLFIP